MPASFAVGNFGAVAGRRRPSACGTRAPRETTIGTLLDTRALAVAGGLVFSWATFGLTLLFLVGPGEPAALRPLAGVLFGYEPTVPGAFVGALWAYPYGFLGAGAVAFVYNLAVVPPPPSGLEDGGSPAEEVATRAP